MTGKRPIAIVLGLMLTLAACGGDDEPSGGGGTPTGGGQGSTSAVEVRNLAFAPQTLNVTAGTVVTWTNQDEFPHTVTSGDPNDQPTGIFDNPIETKGSSATFQFKEAGTFPYYCKVHPQMTATVVVS